MCWFYSVYTHHMDLFGPWVSQLGSWPTCLDCNILQTYFREGAKVEMCAVYVHQPRFRINHN